MALVFPAICLTSVEIYRIANPILSTLLSLGSDPCTILTWCRDISPGSSSRSIAWFSSKPAIISCPLVRRLSLEKVSWCSRAAPSWLPGMTLIQPFDALLGEKATHAVSTS